MLQTLKKFFAFCGCLHRRRRRQPQTICHFYLAGRGQRHLLRHAYSCRCHCHSGAAAKECHHGDTLDELVNIPGKYKEFIDIRKKAEGWNLAE